MEEFILTVVLNTMGTTVTKTATFQAQVIEIKNPGKQHSTEGKSI